MKNNIVELNSSSKESNETTDQKSRDLEQMNLLINSGYFDVEYYVKNNPTITKESAIADYFYSGYLKGRNPSAFFDSYYYMERNPDVSEDGMNPLLHYVLFGKKKLVHLQPS